MRLAELSTAERRYLSSPLPPVDTWTPRLIARLNGVLRARMKHHVQIVAVAPDPRTLDREHAEPEISWDSALDALWVHARLGGNARITACAALSRNLRRTLQQALAETWMSSAQHSGLPRMVHLRIESTSNAGGAPAMLTIYFPTSLSQMDRWARRMNA